MQPEKTPTTKMVKSLVPVDDAGMKQYESEVMIQGHAKRLDLNISPSLSKQIYTRSRTGN